MAAYQGKPPMVLDMFSGRGIIPLEAARAGATAVGIDVSPVATLAGRLLADYPARDWSAEPHLPFAATTAVTDLALDSVQALSTPGGCIHRARGSGVPHYPRCRT